LSEAVAPITMRLSRTGGAHVGITCLAASRQPYALTRQARSNCSGVAESMSPNSRVDAL